jgi:hypothetical protein
METNLITSYMLIIYLYFFYKIFFLKKDFYKNIYLYLLVGNMIKIIYMNSARGKIGSLILRWREYIGFGHKK